MIALNASLADDLVKSSATSLHSPSYSEYLDSIDPLASLRPSFHIPLKSTVVSTAASEATAPSTVDVDQSEECVYMAGNSLGLMPKSTTDYIQQELAVWSSQCVRQSLSAPRTTVLTTTDMQQWSDRSSHSSPSPSLDRD